uniref:NADP-dependent oxidoreductase domain-containing protein 1 n=2 Tax=Petromyzon marinus TaxID=7757 RepID=A0AAJ7WVX8_PETMA|nr:NADP-dependent oxidoreductase domain-containing protein 1 [Petromyzon marinus]
MSSPGDAEEDVTSGLAGLGWEAAAGTAEGDGEAPGEARRLQGHAAALCVASGRLAAWLSRTLGSIERTVVSGSHVKGSAPSSNPGPLVSVLGCGRLGRVLARALLDEGCLDPTQLLVSTRRPHLLRDLGARGVHCCYDNALAASSRPPLLLLCVLPSQLDAVAADMQGLLHSRTLVLSFTSAVPPPRLKQLLGHGSVMKPEFVMDCVGQDDCHTQLEAGPGLKPSPRVTDGPPEAPTWGHVARPNPRTLELCACAALNACATRGLPAMLAATLVARAFAGSGQGFRVRPGRNDGDGGGGFAPSPACAASLMPDRQLPHADLVVAWATEMPLSLWLGGHPSAQELLLSALQGDGGGGGQV